MFVIGLLTMIASIATIRYYYSLLLPEVELIVGGIVTFAIAFFSIRILRDKESGITFKRDRFSSDNTMLYAQALIVNSQTNFGHTSETSPMPFGGGGFSGGGAGETF